MFRSTLLLVLMASSIIRAAAVPVTASKKMEFEPNHGQAPSRIVWIARHTTYQIQFRKDGAMIVFTQRGAHHAEAIVMQLEGSRSWQRIEGLEPTNTVSNYQTSGRGITATVNGIPHFARLRVPEVYKNIDLVFYDNGGNLGYDFDLHPGADAKQIRVNFDGQRSMRVDKTTGDLLLTTLGGSVLRQSRPNLYRTEHGQRTFLKGQYEVIGLQSGLPSAHCYELKKPTIIEPVVEMAKVSTR